MLADIVSLLYQPEKGRQDSVVNSLHKKKNGKEMRMNVQIGDYEVDSVILDLGLDVNILTKKTWKLMGNPMLGWSSIQLHLENQARTAIHRTHKGGSW